MSEQPPKKQVTDVRIVDIEIPISAIVSLLFKCIPAILVVAVVIGLVLFALKATVGG